MKTNILFFACYLLLVVTPTFAKPALQGRALTPGQADFWSFLQDATALAGELQGKWATLSGAEQADLWQHAIEIGARKALEAWIASIDAVRAALNAA